MKSLLLICFLYFPYAAFAQSDNTQSCATSADKLNPHKIEIKVYAGSWSEILGLDAEYLVNDRLGIALSGSFAQIKDNNFSYIDGEAFTYERHTFINLSFKRYSSKMPFKNGLFYGGYLRYWLQTNGFLIKDWTTAQKDEATLSNHWLSTQKSKYTVGALCGYKWRLKERLCFEIALGLGYTPNLYFYKESNYNTTEEGKVPNNWEISLLDLTGTIPSFTPYLGAFIHAKFGIGI